MAHHYIITITTIILTITITLTTLTTTITITITILEYWSQEDAPCPAVHRTQSTLEGNGGSDDCRLWKITGGTL